MAQHNSAHMRVLSLSPPSPSSQKYLCETNDISSDLGYGSLIATRMEVLSVKHASVLMGDLLVLVGGGATCFAFGVVASLSFSVNICRVLGTQREETKLDSFSSSNSSTISSKSNKRKQDIQPQEKKQYEKKQQKKKQHEKTQEEAWVQSSREDAQANIVVLKKKGLYDGRSRKAIQEDSLMWLPVQRGKEVELAGLGFTPPSYFPSTKSVSVMEKIKVLLGDVPMPKVDAL